MNLDSEWGESGNIIEVTRQGRLCESSRVGLAVAVRALLPYKLEACCIKIWSIDEDAILLSDRQLVVLAVRWVDVTIFTSDGWHVFPTVRLSRMTFLFDHSV